MQCADCGSYIAEGKRFCADCGAPAHDPEVTRVARPPRNAAPYAPPRNPVPYTPPRNAVPVRAAAQADEPEHIVFTARPTLLFIQAGYALAALGSLLLAFLLAWLPPLLLGSKFEVPWYIWLPVSLSVFLLPAYQHFKRNLVRYTMTPSKLEIDEGFIARTTRNIPLTKVQDVTVSSGLLQRLLGYGDVVLDNASEQGGKIVLHNIQDPRRHADLLLRYMRQS